MNLESILSEHRIPYKTVGQHHHATRDFIQVDCPYCSPRSSKWRMGLAIDGSVASCWTCGARPLNGALVTLLRKPWQDVASLLGLLGRPRQSHGKRDVAGIYKPPADVGPLLPAHRRYLAGRGFDVDEVSRLWGLQGIGLAAHLKWRIFLPIMHHGEAVSWTTRSIASSSGAKYINAKPEEEAVSAKTLLYGADYLRHAVVIVEGPFSAIAIGPGAAATMGLIVTPAQILALSRYPIRAICFDAEPGAQRRARRLASTLSCYPGETEVIELETGNDPADAEQEEIEEIRQRFLQ